MSTVNISTSIATRRVLPPTPSQIHIPQTHTHIHTYTHTERERERQRRRRRRRRRRGGMGTRREQGGQTNRNSPSNIILRFVAIRHECCEAIFVATSALRCERVCSPPC